MGRVVNVLIIFLCFTIIQFEISYTKLFVNTRDDIGALQEAAHEMTSRRKVSPNFSVVRLQSASCLIYYYDKEELQVLQDSNDKNKSLSKFYVCMNCVFAEWIRKKLYEFVQEFPLLYQSKFMDEYDTYKSDFNKSLAVLNGIMKQTVRFINILFNFLNIVTYSAFMDIDLLKTLLSFSFKINYINNLQYQYEYDERLKAEKTDHVVIPKILQVINDIQKCILFNCDITSDYANKQFYGYWTTDSEATENGINEFLREIKPMNLETVREYCSTKQMLLGNILVEIEETNTVAKDLQNVVFQIKCENVLSRMNAQKFFEKIQFSDNLEVIFWYMKSVYVAIVQLISKKTFPIVDNLIKKQGRNNVVNLSIDLFEGFKTMHFFFSIYSDLPLDLIESFKSLGEKKLIEIHTLKNVRDHLKTYNSKEMDNSNFILNLPDVEIIIAHSLVTPLENFMNSMINKISDYKCFVNLLEFLYVEYGRYYTPHMKNVKKVFTFMEVELCKNSAREQYKPLYKLYEYFNVENSKPSMSTSVYLANNYDSAVKNSCDLVVKLYQYCFETFIILNNSQRKYKLNGEIDFDEVKENLNSIMQFLSNSTIKFENTPLNSITFNLVPLMPFIAVRLYNEGNYPEIKRLMYVIMSELNTYGIDYCVPPSNNYLLFNNIDLNITGKHNTYFMEWQKCINLISMKKNFPNYSDLIKIFMDQYNNFIVFYDLIVLFKWKGELKPFTEILWDISNTITTPIYRNALYDLYFKLVLAVIYYESQSFMKNLKTDKNKLNEQVIESYDDYFYSKLQPLSNVFPPYFRNFVSNYYSYMVLYYSFIKMTEDQNPTKMYRYNEKKLIDELIIFGVQLDINASKQSLAEIPGVPKTKFRLPWSKTDTLKDRLETFINTVDDLLTTVEAVKNIFNLYESYYTNIPVY
ncbi:Hypothetical protein CINCED_3A024769 [Cinara cedri]|uniref:Uncharacterized protein n=1 Tax=Cinara cedri TaxID=506608 RepID=A0A5E4MUL2_9HEMI|nr:Hypothetical protein CINCED_3A024769 [Cinara cedri]